MFSISPDVKLELVCNAYVCLDEYLVPLKLRLKETEF